MRFLGALGVGLITWLLILWWMGWRGTIVVTTASRAMWCVGDIVEVNGRLAVVRKIDGAESRLAYCDAWYWRVLGALHWVR